MDEIKSFRFAIIRICLLLLLASSGQPVWASQGPAPLGAWAEGMLFFSIILFSLIGGAYSLIAPKSLSGNIGFVLLTGLVVVIGGMGFPVILGFLPYAVIRGWNMIEWS